MQRLSLAVASGGHSSSRCAGLSPPRPLLLRSTGSRRAGPAVVAHGPSRSAACGIPPDQGPNPCTLHRQADSQPLRHQGSPIIFFLKIVVIFSLLNLFIYLFIYLFLAVLGLRFCARAFSSCGKRGPLFIAVRRPLTIAASLVAEHRLQTRRLSSCGSQAQLLRGMWDLPRPGLEPMSPALAGRFSTTAPPGKPYYYFLNVFYWSRVDLQCCVNFCCTAK